MIGPRLARDGAPLSQLELAQGLAGRGWDIRAWSPADGPLAARYRAAGVPLEIEPRLCASAAAPSLYEADISALAEPLSALAPDLVYVNTVDMFPAIDAARLAGLPSVWNIRESEPWRARLADRHTAIAARALAAFGYPESVVFVAEAARTAWSGFTPAERSTVVYNAAAPWTAPDPAARIRLREEAGAGPGEMLIVAVGTLCERKGQIDLARAVARLPASLLDRTRLAFVGRIEEAYLARVQEALPRAARARFLGPVEDAADRIAAADLLVHCSRSEAFPRIFLEAARARTPIVATPVDGTVERLEDGRSALFYAPGEDAALARAIKRVLSDPALGDSLAANAYNDLLGRWTFDDMAGAYHSRLRAAAGLGARADGSSSRD